VSSSVSLSNTALAIKLYNGSFSASTLVDTAGDGNTPIAGSNSNPKASMERTQSSGWQNATTSVNQDANTSDLATPKAANSSAPVVTPPAGNEEPPAPAPADPPVIPTPLEKVAMLFADSPESSSVTLNWEVRNFEPKTFSLWQSDKEGEMGKKIKEFKSTETVYKVSGLTLHQGYYFEVVATDKDGKQIESNRLHLTTPWPKNLAVINEVLPRATASFQPFVEIDTPQTREFFNGWSITDGNRRQVLASEVATQSANNLIAFTLPEDFIQAGVELSLLSPDGTALATITVPDLQEGSRYAKGYDDEYFWSTRPTPNAKNQVVIAGMAEEVAGDQTPDLPPAGSIGLWLLGVSVILSGSGVLNLLLKKS
jgi:hypothetical protein